ncbi:transketolase family protein [Vreelandella neptunia]|uniref:Transketolase family protein n=1 Tax=Vreelandella neptunia TaxID=115551 RepID=A0ABS9SCK0_9GAMM|nr:transketolase C-terminal domain-containing protein [Halomonas neptunia]MCH4813838.1 transketolase family protein [Halomonas neptunia]
MTELFDCRHAFSSKLVELAHKDDRIVLVLNDCLSSSDSLAFLNTFPERVFDLGIAEQNMVGVAAGLANGGYIPFVCAASCFLTARAFEQIKIDIAYSQANVKLCAFSAGIAYGALGPTHHSTEDLALMRTLPGLSIYAPGDSLETERALEFAHDLHGPTFLRINRITVPHLPQTGGFEPGKASTLRDGEDVTLISYGPLLHEVIQAAEILAESGVEAHILNMASISPLDEAAIVQSANRTKIVVVVEDHQRTGGLFSAVAEVLCNIKSTPVLPINIPNEFSVIGSPQQIFEHYGLIASAIAVKTKNFIIKIGGSDDGSVTLK